MDSGHSSKVPLLRGMSEGQGDLKIGDIVKVQITELDKWVLKGKIAL